MENVNDVTASDSEMGEQEFVSETSSPKVPHYYQNIAGISGNQTPITSV